MSESDCSTSSLRASVSWLSTSPTDMLSSKYASLETYLFPGASGSELVSSEFIRKLTAVRVQNKFVFPSMKSSMDIPCTLSLTRPWVRYRFVYPSGIESVFIRRSKNVSVLRNRLVIPFPM